RPAPEPQPVVARAEPAPQPVPAAPAPQAPAPAQSSSNSFLPSALWGGSRGQGSSGPTRYDGAWNATRTCEAYEELPSQTASWDPSVKDGEFVAAVGAPGQPGYSLARGRANDDGVLTPRGDGIASSKRFVGKPHPVFFRGRAEGSR